METTYIGFGGRKGGISKTTIATVLANRLVYKHKKKVIFVDGDPQRSVIKRRDVDLNEFESSDLPDNLYEIIYIDPNNMLDIVLGFEGEYDYVILDFPGATDIPGVKRSYLACDHLFIPMDVSPLEFDSNIEFIEEIQKEQAPKRESAGYDPMIIRGIFSRIFINQKEYKLYSSKEGRAQLPIEFLKNPVPYMSDVLKRNINTVVDYETLLPKNKKLGILEEFDKLYVKN